VQHIVLQRQPPISLIGSFFCAAHCSVDSQTYVCRWTSETITHLDSKMLMPISLMIREAQNPICEALPVAMRMIMIAMSSGQCASSERHSIAEQG